MPPLKKRVVIFGVTGSVGQQSLEVLQAHGHSLVGISYRTNLRVGKKVAADWGVKHVYCPDGSGSCASYGQLLDLAKPDIVLNAVSGFAGLQPTIDALSRGIPLALANKESLVVAGRHVMSLASEKGVPIYPVDSEHASVYDLLRRDRPVSKVILTASGGPFAGFSAAQLSSVTKEQAIKHPRWSMGAKISVDSATMMNKALELIEAHWLFGCEVTALLHPQAIVHAIVAYTDHSYAALMAYPDMKWAIQRALNGFKKNQKPVIKPIDFSKLALDFALLDKQRWPALELAERCIRRADSTLPVIVNALNERAVAMFLKDELSFDGIVKHVVDHISDYAVVDHPSLDQITAAHEQVMEGK